MPAQIGTTALKEQSFGVRDLGNPFKTQNAMHDAPAVPNQPTTTVDYFRENAASSSRDMQQTSSSAITMQLKSSGTG